MKDVKLELNQRGEKCDGGMDETGSIYIKKKTINAARRC